MSLPRNTCKKLGITEATECNFYTDCPKFRHSCNNDECKSLQCVYYVPKLRPPTQSYSERLSFQHTFETQNSIKVHDSLFESIMSPKSQKQKSVDVGTRIKTTSNVNAQETHEEFENEALNLDEVPNSPGNSSDQLIESIMPDEQINNYFDNYEHSKQMLVDDIDGKEQENCKGDSLKKSSGSPRHRPQHSSNSIQKDKNFFDTPYFWILWVAVSILLLIMLSYRNGNRQMQSSSNLALIKSVEDIRINFRNQDPTIWNDISFGLKEVSRNSKAPLNILLFANETTTMDCFAKMLAHAVSNILGSESPLQLNPEDFGDDPGEIISTLKEKMLRRKAVIIYDVLSINFNAIQALHNLCDTVNPLIEKIIYIITMQTNSSYESSEKKLAFVEKQIFHQLSRNIDPDILLPLVVRMTDGIIISVQPEPILRYCPKSYV